jgi:hypothetical protein
MLVTPFPGSGPRTGPLSAGGLSISNLILAYNYCLKRSEKEYSQESILEKRILYFKEITYSPRVRNKTRS